MRMNTQAGGRLRKPWLLRAGYTLPLPQSNKKQLRGRSAHEQAATGAAITSNTVIRQPTGDAERRVTALRGNPGGDIPRFGRPPPGGLYGKHQNANTTKPGMGRAF